MIITEGLKFEILKFLRYKYALILIYTFILLVIFFLFLNTLNFGKNYFDAVNHLKVANVFDYYFTKLFIINGLIISFAIVFSAFQIYQIESRSNILIKILTSETSYKNILNNKLKLHLFYNLLTIILLVLVILLFSFFVLFRFKDYTHYSREPAILSVFKHTSLFVIKAINCCFLIRIMNKIFKKSKLFIVFYILLVLNNLVFVENIFNFYHVPQHNYISKIFIATLATFVLGLILIYENRIFKTQK
jgi:hypothetical protein